MKKTNPNNEATVEWGKTNESQHTISTNCMLMGSFTGALTLLGFKIWKDQFANNERCMKEWWGKGKKESECYSINKWFLYTLLTSTNKIITDTEGQHVIGNITISNKDNKLMFMDQKMTMGTFSIHFSLVSNL